MNRIAIALLAALAVAACPKPAADNKGDKPDVDKPKPALTAPEAPKGSDPLCVGKQSTTPEEKLEIAGKTYLRKGTTISMQGSDADDELVVGQISDIKDHNPDNAANLQVLLGWMKSEKVDVITVTGDLGETADSIEKVVRDVAAVGVPVLVVIGNRE
ncbi:MAG TPA: metallophosphoesterase, partial [Myxococcota bacterium]